jgi:DeoR family transcriptional regulator, fructose operon transcriptional repressor
VTAGGRTWFADERHAEVHRQVASEHRVESTRLARHFGVSAESIRKDLAQQETRGLLRRVTGGAVTPQQLERFQAADVIVEVAR